MATPDDPQAQVQQLAVTAEQLRTETDTLQQQLVFLQTSLQQLRGAGESLDELKRREENPSAVLMPVGGGYYVKAQIPATEEILASIGSGIYKSFSLAEGIERAKTQTEAVEKQIAQIDQLLSEKMAYLNSVNRELESILAQAQAERK
ncbi:MAG: prefoldin subunit alpha [Candidatus Heimdallarchaeota archaeon]